MGFPQLDPSAFALDPSLLLAPFLIAVVLFAVVAWVGVMGGSLRLSLWLVLDDPPGFLVCSVAALGIVAINIAVFLGIYLAFGPQPWYVITCYQALLQVVLVSLVARCNPVSAFFAAFGHTFFSLVGTAVLAVVVLLTCGSTIRSSKERQQAIVDQQGPREVANPFAQ